MKVLESRVCPRCSSRLLAWDEEDDCAHCLGCGWRDNKVTPLGEWYARQERLPSADYWPSKNSKAPPTTRRYE